MTRSKFLAGLALTGFLTLCCVTPLLPWLLAVIGLGGLIPLLVRDAVLLPLLALSAALTLLAWHRGRVR